MIRDARDEDLELVVECLTELGPEGKLNASNIRRYLEQYRGQRCSRMLVYEESTGETVGVATVNRLEMPRLLGHGYEIEEIVVPAHCRGRGVGSRFMAELALQLRQDPLARKLLIKTDDSRAASLYRRVLEERSYRVFQTFLNKL